MKPKPTDLDYIVALLFFAAALYAAFFEPWWVSLLLALIGALNVFEAKHKEKQ